MSSFRDEDSFAGNWVVAGMRKDFNDFDGDLVIQRYEFIAAADMWLDVIDQNDGLAITLEDFL